MELKRKKLVLITGASHGIGKALAECFAKAGQPLALNGRDEEALYSFCEELHSRRGIPVLPVPGDVSDFAAVQKIFQKTDAFAKELGLPDLIDLLINNAGVSYIGLLQEMEPDEWNRVIGTNLTGVFNTCHEAIPRMLHSHCGRILNVSSIWGVSGASCEAAYSASKGGVNALTEALAKELAPSEISVNAVAFGVIDTRMNDVFTRDERRALTEEIPAGRMATPEEAAEFCYLLCQADPYMTGQIVRYDGGFL